MEARKIGNIYGYDGGNYAGNVYDQNHIAPTLTNMQGGGRQPMIIDDTLGFEEKPRIYNDYSPSLRSERSGLKTIQVNDLYNQYPRRDCCLGTLATNSGNQFNCGSMGISETRVHKIEKYRIRKLTPKECWRLMAFTDEDFHKAEAVNSNSQLYKQAGNSIVVSVLEAIFRQMNIQNIPTWNEVYHE